MLGEGFLQHLAVRLIILERLYLGDSAEAFESSEVRLVYVGKMWVRDHYIRQRLNVAQTMRESVCGQDEVSITFRIVYTWWEALVDSNLRSRADGTL